MMKFALLLFDAEGYWDRVSPDEMGAAVAEHAAFAAYLREKGVAFSGEAVKPAAEAWSLRPSPQGPISRRGPMVELRQDLAGFYVIECAGAREAEEIARRCPLGAGIEIRPIWDAPS
ncbi:YciI family protein [Nonomuraea sp. NPDC050790]|uniref:YciI family protein n=1 Tax=Nonomuraea sp. NPDC050790 TaxID=3364371 RepID=UPI0037BCB31A